MSIILMVLACILSLVGMVMVQVKAGRERMRRLEIGRAGEKRVAGLLDTAGAADRLDGLTLCAGGKKVAQIDHLIRGKSTFVVAETKNWSGVLSGNATDRQWMLTRPSGNVQKMRNPILQATRQAKVVSRFAVTQIPVIPLVIMAGRASHVTGTFPDGVISARELPNVLRSMIKTRKSHEKETDEEIERAWKMIVDEAYSPDAEKRSTRYVNWLEDSFGPKPWRVWLILSLSIATLVWCVGVATSLSEQMPS